MLLAKKLYKIVDDNEESNSKKDDILFYNVIQDFCKSKGTSFKAFMSSDWTGLALSFKRELFYNREDVELFYSFLSKYGYRGEEDINFTINKLGRLNDPNRNKLEIKKALVSPFIDDIEYSNRKFKITSSEFGVIPFSLVKDDYWCNSLENYLECFSFNINNNCHNNTKFMASILPNGYAVTSLCKSYFPTEYFHSYTFDPESDSIVDLCSRAVLSKSDYYSLHSPREISVIPNSEVDEKYNVLRRKMNNKGCYCDLLLLAAYQLYLEECKENPIKRMLI